jgi:Alpha amylase, catalytic domain
MTTLVHEVRDGAFDVFGAECPFGVRLDARSGELVALVDRQEPARATPLALQLSPVWGGTEVLGAIGGLQYRDTESEPLAGLELVDWRTDDRGDSDYFVATAHLDDWEVDLRYDFYDRAPHVGFGVTLRRGSSAPSVRLRDLVVSLDATLGDAADWVVQAPGNQFRADIPLDAITEPLRIFGAADMIGGTGLVALTRASTPETLVVWPLSETEPGVGRFTPRTDGATLAWHTELAGVLDDGDGLAWGTVYLDALPVAWPEVRGELWSWYDRLGATGPAGRPDWIRRAHIYEVHIGFSVFAHGHHYEHYATPADLQADLARIQELGFDVIQLMPRHPYPSYNVHDYADVTTTYGDEAELRGVVEECHRRGMRVLLDIIIHGVVDQEVVDETVASVHAGPYADRLYDGSLDYLSDTREDIAWARHIVEYGPYWRDGSPQRSSLPDEHPDWFMRDSGGRVTRRYTKAFDIAAPSWQEYFLDACLDLSGRLDTDGFRVDAPTYNGFATWAEGRGHRASYGPMAALPLLRELQLRLRALKPDATVYTEPGGSLMRALADMTYNYDEHWLVESLLAEPNHPQRDWRMVRDGRELGRWLQDRDLAHPRGAGIIHHVDSHDSIWWRLPGAQWRRERFGRETTVALLAVFALAMPGGFMTFMGGEEQVEPELRRALRLRRDFPELAAGTCEYLPDAASSDEVLVALRRLGGEASLVIVNLTGAAVTCEVELDGLDLTSAYYDHWSGEDCSGQGSVLGLTLAPYEPRVLGLSGDSVGARER